MRNIFFILAAFVMAGCQQPPYLVVSIDGIPPRAQSLRVLAAHAGTSPLKDPEPIDLALPAKGSQTVLVVLPEGFTGELELSVGAFDQAGGLGCLVATGTSSTAMFAGPEDSLRVALDPATDTVCSGKSPMLLSAAPTLGSTAGSELVALTGWGFKPDASVTMNGKSTSFSFVSASKLLLTTPAKAGIGPATISVANRDGLLDSRKDLFRFFSDSLAFNGYPFSSNPDFTGAGFAISKLNPTTQFDVAITLPIRSQVRVLSVVNSMVRTDLIRDYSVDPNPGPIAIADFDRDGDNDIVVASVDSATITLLVNDGAGGFVARAPLSIGTPVSTPPGSQPSALAAGDLNGDGIQDLVVALKSDGKVAIVLNQGGGALQLAQKIPVGAEPVGLAIADFNQDSLADIAVANQASSGGANPYLVSMLFNQGAGTYKGTGTGELQIPTCTQPTSIAITDTDGNGIPDLVVSCTGADKLRIFRNFGGLNVMPYDLATDSQPRNIVISDLNGDAIPDILVPCAGSDKIDLFLNNRGMGFESAQLISQPADCAMPNQAAIVDLDSDGRADIGVGGSGCISGLFNQSN